MWAESIVDGLTCVGLTLVLRTRAGGRSCFERAELQARTRASASDGLHVICRSRTADVALDGYQIGLISLASSFGAIVTWVPRLMPLGREPVRQILERRV